MIIAQLTIDNSVMNYSYVFFTFRTSIFNLKTTTPGQSIVLQYGNNLIVQWYAVVPVIWYLSSTRYQKITHRGLKTNFHAIC